MDERELALRYLALFRGYSKCFGRFVAAGHLASHKVTGSAETVKRAPDVSDVLRHLRGEARMGMIPLRDDNTVSFCAIDHDAYGENIDHTIIAKQVIDLPLILTRSKSGGAHLWMFSSTPMQAPIVIKTLKHWVTELGWAPKTEVFPKQAERANADDIGNWINLPYFGAFTDNPQCTALVAVRKDNTTRTLTLEEFLSCAEKASPPDKYLNESAMRVRARNPKSSDVLFSDGPPCIQSIFVSASKNGWSEGSRNNTLWHIGVYLARQGHNEAALVRKLSEMNKTNWVYEQPPDKFTVPPLGLEDKEIAAIARSVSRKEYGYKCNEEPMKELCNHNLCKLRTWGIGTKPEVEMADEISAFVTIEGNPAHWFFSYGDRRVHIDNAEVLLTAKKFRVAVTNATGRSFPLLPDQVHNKLITRLQKDGDVRQQDVEASALYALESSLADFIVDAPGDSLEDVVQGKVFTSTDGFIYMRGDAFFKYLQRARNQVRSKQQAIAELQQAVGLEYGDKVMPRIKGRQVRMWRVPASFIEKETRPDKELPGDVM